MSKSIAMQALACAKRQEAQKLNLLKQEFLKIMEEEFDDLKSKYSLSIPAWRLNYTRFSHHSNQTFKEDLEMVASDLGFDILWDYSTITVSIPEWIKGQKRTKAQLMLYWYHIEVKRLIKAEKA